LMARVLWFLAESMRAYTLPRDQLVRLQLRRFSKSIRIAYRTVPYYHELLRRLGAHPEDFRTLEDIRKLPLMQKREVVDNFSRLVSRRGSERFTRGGSGTSGLDVRVSYGQDSRDLLTALIVRRMLAFGMKPWDRVVSIWPPSAYWRRNEDGSPTTSAYEMGAVVSLARITSTIRFLRAAQDDPVQDLARLRALNPDFVMARASHLRRMAAIADGSWVGAHLRGINCVSESFTSACASEIERALGGKVLHSYGSTELGMAGAECRFQQGTHLNEDWNMFEVLKNGEPVGPGERGELVATTLANYDMPLARYMTGDIVEVDDDDRCKCGSSMVRLRSILGRRSDWLRTAKGDFLAPQDVAEFVEAYLQMRDYQLIQNAVDEFEVKCMDPSSEERRLTAPLGEYLSGKVGTRVNLTFSRRDREDIWLKNRSVVCAVR
jgi:phenylacetate-CoA ligase